MCYNRVLWFLLAGSVFRGAGRGILRALYTVLRDVRSLRDIYILTNAVLSRQPFIKVTKQGSIIYVVLFLKTRPEELD